VGAFERINGDFDGGGYTCSDVDALVAEIVAGTNNVLYDLNSDALVMGEFAALLDNRPRGAGRVMASLPLPSGVLANHVPCQQMQLARLAKEKMIETSAFLWNGGGVKNAPFGRA
jgi:hypothetical protein